MGNKFYLSKEGLERIKIEYEELKKIKVAKTKAEVPRLLHSEDLNPEYLSFQEDLDFLEVRIRELENILNNFELIAPPPKNKQNIIGVGATVLAEVNGRLDEFTITGTLEANPTVGKISNESPVGRALLGHRVGDEVVISSPQQMVYRIKKIKYNLS